MWLCGTDNLFIWVEYNNNRVVSLKKCIFERIYKKIDQCLLINFLNSNTVYSYIHAKTIKCFLQFLKICNKTVICNL